MEPVLAALAPAAVDALPALCRRFHVRQLDLIGSAADGRFDPARSDLDFLVNFEDAPRSGFNDYFDLRDGLSALFGRQIDLVSESTVENPYFRRAIQAQRKQVFPPAQRSVPIAIVDRSVGKYLWDARAAAQRIVRFTTGRSSDEYLSDVMFRSAVERQFEIVGEALNGLRRLDPAMASKIADLPRIVAFRNVLIHGYDAIDNGRIWATVEQELPAVIALMDELLNSLEPPPADAQRE